MTTALMNGAAIVRQLPNGITIAMERLPYLRSVAAGIWIQTGSGNETAAEAGISHFLEHLFFKGTTRRTALEISEAIEHKGGQINAFTSRDYTCLYVKVLDNHITTGIDILTDILIDSQFYELEKERNVILEEIASGDDVPEELLHDKFMTRCWPSHPLGRPIAGFTETVSAIGLPEIQNYYRTWYKPENIIVSVAGNFDPEAVYSQFAEALAQIPRDPLARLTDAPAFNPGSEYVERDISQCHVSFGFPGPAIAGEERFTYDILCSTLGGGSSSRLFQRIREEAGLAYSIYSFLSTHALGGVFGVYAAVAPENLEQAIELSVNELRDFRDRSMNAEELEQNKEQLKGGLLMALENTFNRMARMAKNLMFHGRILPVEEIVERLDAVTPERIQALAGDIVTPERATLVVLGPAGGPRIEALPL